MGLPQPDIDDHQRPFVRYSSEPEGGHPEPLASLASALQATSMTGLRVE